MARILVLLEPFPIRNTFGAHAWIGERLGRMLLEEGKGSALADMRIACNTPTMTYLAGVVPAARPYFLGIPTVAEAPFAAAMKDWHTSGIVEWRAIQAGSAAHQDAYTALLNELRAGYPFEVLAYWGTNETLRAAAAGMGIPMIWAEFGPLRPPFPKYYCLDLEGVNGRATGRDTIRLLDDEALPTMPHAALRLTVQGVSAYEATMALPPPETAPQFSVLMQFVKGKRKVILLALQLADDANLLAFGNGWTSVAVVERLLKLNEGPGVGFILRPHPGEGLSFHNMASGDAARALVTKRDDVLVFDAAGESAYLACLSVATEVVSINSSVGFEATVLGKPVRVLGDASYMPPGGGADLVAAPALLHSDAVDMLLQDRFIPEDRFWTLACWREKATAALGEDVVAGPVLLPRLPTAVARVVGAARETGDGSLVVDGIGALYLLPRAGLGAVDLVSVNGALPNHVTVRGWGSDPRTGGTLAGFVITTGEQSVWCAAVDQRLDVARHFGHAGKLAAGFIINITATDMPSLLRRTVVVYGVTVSGSCQLLRNRWTYDAVRTVFETDEMARAA